jgi:hypothetical protein
LKKAGVDVVNNDALIVLGMTICQRCLKEYEAIDTQKSPMEELGQIFLRSVSSDYADRLCPDCKKELGILNLLGFGE